MRFRPLSLIVIALTLVSLFVVLFATEGVPILFRMLSVLGHVIAGGCVAFWAFREPEAQEGQYETTVGIGALAIVLIVVFGVFGLFLGLFP